MNYSEIVKKLIGPIQPVGESNEDKFRLENIKETITLAEYLISELNYVAKYKDSPYSSEKVIGILANNFKESLKEY